MTDPDTIARLRAEQQHARRLGPEPSGDADDYWEPMPHLTVEDWSERIREAEDAAEWLAADDDRWPSGWYIGGLIIIALAALLALAAWGLTSAAAAHEWYSPYCCSDRDCAPVAEDAVSLTGDAYRVQIPAGTHPMAVEDLDLTIPLNSQHIYPSQDGDWHACLVAGRLRCLYAPMRY